GAGAGHLPPWGLARALAGWPRHRIFRQDLLLGLPRALSGLPGSERLGVPFRSGPADAQRAGDVAGVGRQQRSWRRVPSLCGSRQPAARGDRVR
ncbi:hypothetical protein ABTH15_19320, partial [Acinetobacter baumannii]